MLVGLVCKMDDIEDISVFCEEQIDWLRRYLPFENGVAPAQTLRRALRALDPGALAGAFSSWVARLRARLGDRPAGVVAIDGKTLRGSKRDRSGSGALHVVSAYAHEAGLVLAARAVETKGNEITAIPELLDMLALEGAIVTIDAMGTQKAIAEKIVARKGDYVLASKENQPALHADVEEFFADPALAKSCAEHPETDAGHGRIEERRARVADAAGSQNAIRTGRDCSRSRRSTVCDETRKPEPPRRKRGSTSRPCRQIPSASSPRAALTGASKIICTGRSM